MELHETQQLVFENPMPNRVVAAGRGWGKSTLAKAVVEHALSYDLRVAVVGAGNSLADYGQMKVDRWLCHIWSEDNSLTALKWNLHLLGTPAPLTQEMPITVEYDLLVLLEAAYIPALEVVMRFANHTHAFSKRLIVGTPAPQGLYGEQFRTLFRMGQATDFLYVPDWVAWQFHTRENPHIARADVIKQDKAPFVTGAFEA